MKIASHGIQSFAIVSALLLSCLSAAAQTVCLPLPRLLTTMPMGGKVGSEVEVVITGENLEDASELIFTRMVNQKPTSGSSRSLQIALRESMKPD